MNHNSTLFRRLLLVAVLFFTGFATAAQTVEYVDDEECGCELVFIDGIQTTQDGEFFGFKREDGVQITPNKYRYVGKFVDGYCIVYIDYGQCGMIDRDGREIVPCIYDKVEYPRDNRIKVVKNGLMGYTDLSGRVVIPIQYQACSDFSEGRAAVMVTMSGYGTGCTFVDTMGKMLFPPEFELVEPYSCGYAIAKKNNLWGVINRQGEAVLPMQFTEITNIIEGFFFAGTDKGWALYDTTMTQLSPYLYNWTHFVADRRIPVGRNGKYGYLDPKGREVIPCKYDEVSAFVGERAVVKLGEYYGIIDTAGREITPIEYTDKTTKGRKFFYCDSLALVEKNGKIGYVDYDGNLVIPFLFDEGYQFSQGFASVKYDGGWGYINKKGEVYIPFIFDAASPFEWGRADVVYGGQFMKMNLKGKCVKNCKGIVAWRNWTE
ncbi:MAG: WG repeat-containing protein [Bacteroidales bacterium]|nr:WG repeat-containing protein [Bacteroidales bacterium]